MPWRLWKCRHLFKTPNSKPLSISSEIWWHANSVCCLESPVISGTAVWLCTGTNRAGDSTPLHTSLTPAFPAFTGHLHGSSRKRKMAGRGVSSFCFKSGCSLSYWVEFPVNFCWHPSLRCRPCQYFLLVRRSVAQTGLVIQLIAAFSVQKLWAWDNRPVLLLWNEHLRHIWNTVTELKAQSSPCVHQHFQSFRAHT